MDVYGDQYHSLRMLMVHGLEFLEPSWRCFGLFVGAALPVAALRKASNVERSQA